MFFFRNFVLVFILLTLNLAKTVKLTGDDVYKCEAHVNVDSSTFSKTNLQEWKEDTVLTFSVRYKDTEIRQDDQLILLLSNQNETSDQEPFNCLIERDYEGCPAAKADGRCCYNYLKPRIFENDESSSGCNPSSNCRLGLEIKPCRAKCISQMTLQIKFGLNLPPAGGPITLNAMFKKTSFLQSRSVLDGEYFLIIDGEEEAKSQVLYTSVGGSPLNPNVPFGFWVRYSKDNTHLEIGIDGRSLAEVRVNLGNFTLGDDVSTGWLGAEVVNRTEFFQPKFFQFEFISGQAGDSSGGLIVGYNCRTVMYDGYGQEQTSAGACLEDSQCAYGKACKIDAEFVEAYPDLAWTSPQRCQIGWRQLIEQDPVIIILVVSLLGVLLLIIVCPFCLYCDLKKIRPWDACKKICSCCTSTCNKSSKTNN